MLELAARAREEAAPNEHLTIGLNYSNFLLVLGDDSHGEPKGIAPDLARELARQLGMRVSFQRFDNPGALGDAVRDARCDVGFLANEPQRAEQIAFAGAYLEIEAAYMASAASSISEIAQVDQPGVRIVVVKTAAYELWLSRNIKHATVIRASSVEESHRLFRDEGLEVMAGLRKALLCDVQKHSGARLLLGNFTSVKQSIAAPKSRTALITFIDAYVRDIKQARLVEQLIRKHGVEGVSPTS